MEFPCADGIRLICSSRRQLSLPACTAILPYTETSSHGHELLSNPTVILEKRGLSAQLSQEPICKRKSGCVIGQLLATGSLVAEKGKNGRCHDLMLVSFSRCTCSDIDAPSP